MSLDIAISVTTNIGTIAILYRHLFSKCDHDRGLRKKPILQINQKLS